MAPYDSDSGDEDWTNQYDQGPDEDTSILRNGKQALGLTKKYVPTWKPGHAIREFYQNWKDAIMSSFDLTSKEVEVDVKGFDAKRVYIVEARHKITRTLLGFIRFQDGVLEFTNFKAQLSRKALDMGESSKRDDIHAAGTHGEGFKVAALVMLRKGYRVRYESSKFYWNFQFGGKDQTLLYCSLREMQASKLARLMAAYSKKTRKGDPRELKSNIWEDVSVKIGQKFRGLGTMIEEEDFQKWIEVSIDLNQPSKIIETRHGTLILDDAFRGRIYLKGLLLEGENSSRGFSYGYNFKYGQVNRDRERLTDPNQEAATLVEIWQEAIEKDKAGTIKKYVDLLRVDKAADVRFAKKYISRGTAEHIWKHLLEVDTERKLFYHDDKNGDTDTEIICNSLQKEPCQLSEALWLPLKSFGLVRTPREQQHHLLNNAPQSETTSTPYSTGVQRALKAALDFDAKTRQLELSFKSGARTDLDLLLSDKSLQINDKWLDFEKSHKSTSCYLYLQKRKDDSQSHQFVCVHVVESLYRLVLAEVNRNLSDKNTPKESRNLRYQVATNLRQMPLKVLAEQGKVGEIVVSWMDTEGDSLSRLYGADPKCRVTLHRESTCLPDRSTLLASIFESDDNNDETNLQCVNTNCGCPERIVSQRLSKAIFNHSSLDTDEMYFPMVSRAELKAFFGLPPPDSIKSIELDIFNMSTENEVSSPRIVSAAQATVEEDDSFDDGDGGTGFDDLYDATPVPSARTGDKSAASAHVSSSSSCSVLHNDAESSQSESSKFEQSISNAPASTSGDPQSDSQVEVLSGQVKILDLQVKARDHEISNLRDGLLQSRAENESLEAITGEKRQEIEEYLSKNNSLKLNWMMCAKDLEAAEEKFITCKSQLADAQCQLDAVLEKQINQSSNATQTESEDFQTPAQVHKLEQQLVIVNGQLQVHLQALEASRKNTVDLEMKYQKQTEDLNKKVADATDHQKKVEDLKKKISVLEIREMNALSSNKALRQDNKLLRDSAKTLDRKLRSAEVEVDQLSSVVASARSERRSISSQTSIKREAGAGIEEAEETAALDLARLRDANAKLAQNLKSAEVEVDSLAIIVDASRSERRGNRQSGGIKREISEVMVDGGSSSQPKRQRMAVENAAASANAIDLTDDGDR